MLHGIQPKMRDPATQRGRKKTRKRTNHRGRPRNCFTNMRISHPLLVLSGVERLSVHTFLSYQLGSSKGLKMGLGSNGSLIDETMPVSQRAV